MTLSRKHLIALAPLLLLLLSSCSGREQRLFLAGFWFAIIFILFCTPGLILGGVSRTSKSSAPKTISIIFTSIGAFFGLIYTFNFLGDRYLQNESQLMLYLFLIWGSLITAAILLGAPNKNKPTAAPIQQQAPRQQPLANPQMSEEAILAAAEKIKQKKAQQENPAANSEFLNPKPTSNNDEVDMSGLDDLADL